MTTRKAIALTGLVLALAILSPASALAAAGGTARPMEGTISATVELNRETGRLTAKTTGFIDHVGRNTGTLAGHISSVEVVDPLLDPPLVRLGAEGLRPAEGWTITAANGDKLYGDFHMSTDDFQLGAPHTDTMEMTITGGSGRFEGADGTLNADVHVGHGTFVDTDDDEDKETMVSKAESTLKGQISY
jgi:hypothetical protein